MTMTPEDWRDHLSVPPKQHTFAELMRTIILMAMEDAATAEADYSPAVEHLSARAEFKARVGYDLYDVALEFLDAPIFQRVDAEGETTLTRQILDARCALAGHDPLKCCTQHERHVTPHRGCILR